MNRFLTERFRRRLDGELGTIFKDHGGKLRVALAYPNRYYLGMSNVGFQGVYKFWNAQPDVVCERVFLPDRVELAEMRRSCTPLVSLESQTPVRDFDVLAFSLTFEPDELNMVRMLDLAGISPWAAERSERDPFVLMGGPVSFLNPEPIAPFMDLIAVGEAEALLGPLTEALLEDRDRRKLMTRLTGEDGFYAPSIVDVDYGSDGSIVRRRSLTGEGPLDGEHSLVRAKMGKRADLPPPATYVLTAATEMSKKFLVEVSRGCPTLCRFCWAGYNYMPKRSFGVDRILDCAREAREHTSDIGLVSTAVGAHKEIVPLLSALQKMDYRISVSSLRFEDLREELVDPLVESGERTLAVAPEVGTDRLRFSIHKRVTNDEILEKSGMLFDRGVENLKLYVMVGLPGEQDPDVEGIVELVSRIRDQMRERGRARGRVGRIIPSVNPFIPKPGTPFQWHPMEDTKLLSRKMRFLQRELGKLDNVDAHCKSPRQERLQALLALGDRRVAPVLLAMARGEGDMAAALKAAGLSLSNTIHRARDFDELLPWGHIDNGMKPELLTTQYEKAQTHLDETPINSVVAATP